MIIKIDDWKFEERLSKEFESVGFFISDHPLNQFKEIFEEYFIEKQNRTDSNPEISLENGILVSSGLIAGESLMGIILAFIAGAGIKSLNLGLDPNLINIATVLSVMFFGIWFFKESKPEKDKSR